MLYFFYFQEDALSHTVQNQDDIPSTSTSHLTPKSCADGDPQSNEPAATETGSTSNDTTGNSSAGGETRVICLFLQKKNDVLVLEYFIPFCAPLKMLVIK